MINFLKNILAFGKDRQTVIKGNTKKQMQILIIEHPDLWEAVQETAFVYMNVKARGAVQSIDDQKKLEMIKSINAVNDFIKFCLTIDTIINDNDIDKSQPLPILNKQDVVKRQELKNKDVVMSYLLGEDLKNKPVNPKHIDKKVK